MLIRSPLHWLRHICRMGDTRVPKQSMYGEIVRGSRPVGQLKLRSKALAKTLSNVGMFWKVGSLLSTVGRSGVARLRLFVETIPRTEFLRMKGKGHLREKRDKSVFHPSAESRRIYTIIMQICLLAFQRVTKNSWHSPFNKLMLI